MKKFVVGYSIFFILFTVLIWLYLYLFSNTPLPAEYVGSAADPLTFIDPERYEWSHQYRLLMNLIYFVSFPFLWGIYLFILFFGLAKRYRSWTKSISRFAPIQTVIYVFLISITTFLAGLPISYIRYYIMRQYEISNLTFIGWLHEKWLQFSVDWILTVLAASAIYLLMKVNFKRWWVYTWLLSIPFIIFLFYIQPIVIDPLYNEFYPIKDQHLEKKILELAGNANIPAHHVYEVNMSEKTNTLNAYVNGMGSSLRIVLWDTLLQTLNEDEILFVTAHEMGHYVMHHLYWNAAGMILFSFVGLFVAHLIMRWLVNRWGRAWGIPDMRDIASLPILLLIFSMLTFASQPITNAISRHAEHAADRYAIELTKNPEAAVDTFQKMTIIGLNDVNPPALVKIFRYGHPTMLERIRFMEQYGE